MVAVLEKVIIYLSLINFIFSQLEIIKYIPGNYLYDDKNTIIIKNNSNKTIWLKDYFIITRDYIIRIPENIYIKGKERIAFVKKDKKLYPFKTIEFRSIKDFIVRIRSRQEQGNYVALLNPLQEMVDGLYFSMNKYVKFLPEIVKLITGDNKIIFINIPSENYKKWQYIHSIEDPIIAFEKINNKWEIVSANPEKDILKLNYFSLFEVKFKKNYNLINAYIHSSLPDFSGRVVIKKSEDGKNYYLIDSLYVSYRSRYIKYYDTHIKKGKSYYYQLILYDNRGYVIRSNIVEVIAEEKENIIEIIPSSPYSNEEFYVYLKLNQNIKCRIILFTDKFELLEIIYDGFVEEELAVLIPVKYNLLPGNYYLLLDFGSSSKLLNFNIK